MNTRKLLAVLAILGVVAGLVVGAVLLVRANMHLWDPYYRAALEIEDAYGDYVDVTYIGPVESKTDVLVYVIIITAQFPGADSSEWIGYDAMVGRVLGSLVKDEKIVTYVMLLPGASGPQATMLAEFDAQALKAGASMTDALQAVYPLSGTLKADPYLKWVDK